MTTITRPEWQDYAKSVAGGYVACSCVDMASGPEYTQRNFAVSDTCMAVCRLSLEDLLEQRGFDLSQPYYGRHIPEDGIHIYSQRSEVCIHG